MDIGQLLSRDAVVLRGAATSKRQALHMLSDAASGPIGASPDAIFAALMQREALGSTGLGAGVAVPHARIAGLDRVRGVFVKLDGPTPFDAVDDRPVDLLFGLFAPPHSGAEHLRALAAVSRSLREPALRAALREARTPDALHALFLLERQAAAA